MLIYTVGILRELPHLSVVRLSGSNPDYFYVINIFYLSWKHQAVWFIMCVNRVTLLLYSPIHRLLFVTEYNVANNNYIFN